MTSEQLQDQSEAYSKWIEAMIVLLGDKTLRLEFPLGNYSKADVIIKGSDLGIDFSQTWSCFLGFDGHCGNCTGCMTRKDAFQCAGVQDPTAYDAP